VNTRSADGRWMKWRYTLRQPVPSDARRRSGRKRSKEGDTTTSIWEICGAIMAKLLGRQAWEANRSTQSAGQRKMVDEVVIVAGTFGVGISAIVPALRFRGARCGEVSFDDSYQAL